MIYYESIKKEYNYKREDVDSIRSDIEKLKQKTSEFETFSKEEIVSLISKITFFLDNVQEISSKAIVSRKENETEARQCFGDEFISNFESLLTKLRDEKVVTAIHGTNEETAQKICSEGLKYHIAKLGGTAELQPAFINNDKIEYGNYAGLLNWEHRNCKHLVIVGVPYECLRDKGLWRNIEGVSDKEYLQYVITSDFIVGYIDVENKNIVMNPNYNRNHNYNGTINQNEMNFSITDELLEESSEMEEELNQQISMEKSKFDYDSFDSGSIDDFDIPDEKLHDFILNRLESIYSRFNGMVSDNYETYTEDKYNIFLKQVLKNIKYLSIIVDRLQTFDEINEKNQNIFDPFTAFDSGITDQNISTSNDEIELDESSNISNNMLR